MCATAADSVGVGFLDWLRSGSDLAAAHDRALTAATYTLSGRGDVAQVANLPAEIAAAFGINLTSDYITREQALSIPAVRRGRDVIVTPIAAAPMVCTRQRAGKAPERVERAFLTHPDPDTTAQWHYGMTVDSLIFYGFAWWLVLARDSFGFPSAARWVDPSRVRIDCTTGTAYVDSLQVAARDLIRFDGPNGSLLKDGARALKTYVLLEEAVRRYARLDVPLGLIEDEESQMTEDEVQAFLDAWEAARIKRTTGYLPRGLKYSAQVFSAEQVELGNARAFASAEIARAMNLPPSAVNAPTNDSLTYATTESNRRELVDMTLRGYVTALEQRLSMGDITPTGTTVSVDLGRFMRGDLQSVLTAAKTAVEAGVMTVDEIRTEWLGLPPLTPQESA